MLTLQKFDSQKIHFPSEFMKIFRIITFDPIFGREKFCIKMFKIFHEIFFMKIFLDDETEKKSVEHFRYNLNKVFSPSVHPKFTKTQKMFQNLKF